MVPPLNHPIWKALVTGERELRSANVAINMLLFNCKLRYKSDPSPSNLGRLVSQAHGVFAKYEKNVNAELQQALEER